MRNLRKKGMPEFHSSKHNKNKQRYIRYCSRSYLYYKIKTDLTKNSLISSKIYKMFVLLEGCFYARK